MQLWELFTPLGNIYPASSMTTSRCLRKTVISIHTAVTADDGNTLEVQIRTQEMHEDAELVYAPTGRISQAAAVQPMKTRALPLRWIGCGR